LEQLDAVIEEIRRLMLRSAETVSEERLSRKEAATAVQKQQQQQEDGADRKSPNVYLGSRRISNSLEGKCMSRSS
jgi:hypothetical protein